MSVSSLKLQETARQLGLPSAALEQYLALKAAEVGAHRSTEVAPQDAAELVRAHTIRIYATRARLETLAAPGRVSSGS